MTSYTTQPFPDVHLRHDQDVPPTFYDVTVRQGDWACTGARLPMVAMTAGG